MTPSTASQASLIGMRVRAGKAANRPAPPKATTCRAKSSAQYVAAVLPCVSGLPVPYSSIPPAQRKAVAAQTSANTARQRGSSRTRKCSANQPEGSPLRSAGIDGAPRTDVASRYGVTAARRCLRAPGADLPHDVEQEVDLRIDDRFAAGHQRAGHLAVGVGPRHDVGEAEV